jgi:hypothetical protein
MNCWDVQHFEEFQLEILSSQKKWLRKMSSFLKICVTQNWPLVTDREWQVLVTDVSDKCFRQTSRLPSAPIQCVTRNPLELEQCLANSLLEPEYCPSKLTSGHGPVFGQLSSTWTSVWPTQVHLNQCSANSALPGPVFGQLNSTWTGVRPTQLYLDQCSANAQLPGLLPGPTYKRTSTCLR